MKRKIKTIGLLMFAGLINASLVTSCKKNENLSNEKVIRMSNKLVQPDNFKEVKAFYGMTLGIDSSLINYNNEKKTFFIPNTKVDESYELINQSYLIFKKHNLK